MPYKASYEEDGFLRQIGVGAEEAEPLADNCSLVLVWHTQTYNSYRQGWIFLQKYFKDLILGEFWLYWEVKLLGFIGLSRKNT